MAVIELRGLRKAFGDVEVLRGLDLAIDGPGVFGFLGVNGAGKTTTLRILAGLLDADSGDARLLGAPAGDVPTRARLGYLPQSPAFYPWMRAEESLHFVADLLGLAPAQAKRRAAELLDAMGLADAARRKVKGFSGGMRQRLGLAQALLADPPLLLLDEPVSALDPVGRLDLLRRIEALGEDRTVFFSTHILGDVDRICDRVTILHQGRAVVDDTVAALRRAHLRPGFLLEVDGDAEFVAALEADPLVRAVRRGDDGALRVDVTDPDAAAVRLPRLIADRGLALRRLEIAQPTLEQIFVDVVGA